MVWHTDSMPVAEKLDPIESQEFYPKSLCFG